MKHFKLTLIIILFLSSVIPHVYSGASHSSTTEPNTITYMYGDQFYLQIEYTGKTSVTKIESNKHYQRITKVTGTADIVFLYGQNIEKNFVIHGGKFQMIEKCVDDKPFPNKMKKGDMVGESPVVKYDEYELSIKIPGKFLYSASRNEDTNYRIDHSVKYPGEPEIQLPSV